MKTNRLSLESSPYLLQHAANPVDWYPWSEEAFQKAKEENKAIFLSIGYSTCHWCHVMEHESFEDEEVAKVLNKYFISIKVDREERPDIDSLYMGIAQMMISRGGWPLNLFLTPEKHVFYAGTYFPKLSKLYPNGYEMPGIIPLAYQLGEIWQKDRDRLVNAAAKISENYRKYHLDERDELDTEMLSEIGEEIFNLDSKNMAQASAQEIKNIADKAFHALSHQFDTKYGGFGPAPKFFSPHVYSFLLKYSNRKALSTSIVQKSSKNPANTNEAELSLNMVLKSLVEFRLGGVFDQIGYGFHRYSTDREWLLPHFEKMLYDQASLIIAYSDAILNLKALNPDLKINPYLDQEFKANDFIETFKNTVDETYEYLVKDMLSSENLFYSAEDADSEGEEGLFYTWTINELKDVLNKEELKLFMKSFHLEEDGNFLDESTKEKTFRNIPHLRSLSSLLKLKREENHEMKQLKEILNKLNTARAQRVRPFKDDKVLTDWNALMIIALARAYQANEDIKFFDLAKSVMNSLLKIMRKANGELLKSSRLGIASANAACVNDYAFFIAALIEIIKSLNTKPQHLQTIFKDEAAIIDYKKELLDICFSTQEMMFRKFWDDKNAGFFYADKEERELPLANKEYFDGALASANSIAFSNLLELYKLSASNLYLDKLNSMLKIILANTKRYPTGYGMALVGLESLLEFEPSYACDENGCLIPPTAVSHPINSEKRSC